jgi:hypothetical protein
MRRERRGGKEREREREERGREGRERKEGRKEGREESGAHSLQASAPRFTWAGYDPAHLPDYLRNI